jgi:poly-gamma-glutamate capsule biosynthesis protein CapA/YwtB (metallophosphatase superfamily)
MVGNAMVGSGRSPAAMRTVPLAGEKPSSAETAVVTIALAGDTMLGRGVAELLTSAPDRPLVAAEVAELTRAADLFICNLECCLSDRGGPWPAPGKRFHFRAPPRAAERLAELGVGCVTLANNHALDFGAEALLDTLEHLAAAGIQAVGAGADVDRARRPALLRVGGLKLGVLGVTDHPDDFAAGPARPGVALAPLRAGVPGWLAERVRALAEQADAVLVTPHWGPNMTSEPVPHVRRAAPLLLQAGASLVAGHSAHVFHGVAGPVLYDLGDFLDDYAVDPVLRNDLGLLFLVRLARRGPTELRAVPLELGYCHTRLATGAAAARVRRRFRAACARLGTPVAEDDGHLVVTWR